MTKEMRLEDMTTKIPKNQEMMTIDEVAEELGEERRAIYYQISRGVLEAFKPGKEYRVFRQDFEDYRNRMGDHGSREIPEDALSVEEVAEWLRFHPNHIRRMALYQGMPHHKAWAPTADQGRLYFYRKEVMDYLRERAKTKEQGGSVAG